MTAASNEVALLPCPFCECEPWIEPKNPQTEGDSWTRISCNDCEVAPTIKVCAEHDHYEQAAAAWNTRAHSDPRPVAEGLREADARAIQFAEEVKSELVERAPAYSIRSVERPHFDRAILAIVGLIRACEATKEIGSWEENVEFLLSKCPHTIRGHEGGGPENLIVSLVLTFGRMQHLLATHSPAPMAGATYDFDIAYNGGYAAAASSMQSEMDRLREALEAIGKFVDDFHAPWGSWKTAWWEGEVSDDAALTDNNALKHVANMARRVAHTSTQEENDA